jgi:hypothetical protein
MQLTWKLTGLVISEREEEEEDLETYMTETERIWETIMHFQ